jgi:small subunit ribosomal protein S2
VELTGLEAGADEPAAENEVVDLEAALGGGIRKAPGVIAVDEPEVAERTL